MEKEISKIDNEQKRENYAILKTNLKKALHQHFWFEACMIEYAVIEDRTASILLHTGIVKDPYGKKLSNKLNSIEHQIGKQPPVISKKVDLSPIQEIKAWKEERNEVGIHAYDEDAVQKIAEQGNDLVRRISNDAQNVK